MGGLGRTIPALPVREVGAAVAHYRERFGFECRFEVADIELLYEELTEADVLHPVSRDGVTTTDFGTREFATLDRDGNLLTFFHQE